MSIALWFYLSDATFEGSYDFSDDAACESITIGQLLSFVSARHDTPVDISLRLKSAPLAVALGSAPLKFLSVDAMVSAANEALIVYEAVEIRVDVSCVVADGKGDVWVRAFVPPFQSLSVLREEVTRLVLEGNLHKSCEGKGPAQFVSFSPESFEKRTADEKREVLSAYSLSQDGITCFPDETLPIVSNSLDVVEMRMARVGSVNSPLLPTNENEAPLAEIPGEELLRVVQLMTVRALTLHRKGQSVQASGQLLKLLEGVEKRTGSTSVTASHQQCRCILLRAIASLHSDMGNYTQGLVYISELKKVLPSLPPNVASSFCDVPLLEGKMLYADYLYLDESIEVLEKALKDATLLKYPQKFQYDVREELGSALIRKLAEREREKASKKELVSLCKRACVVSKEAMLISGDNKSTMENYINALTLGIGLERSDPASIRKQCKAVIENAFHLFLSEPDSAGRQKATAYALVGVQNKIGAVQTADYLLQEIEKHCEPYTCLCMCEVLATAMRNGGSLELALQLHTAVLCAMSEVQNPRVTVSRCLALQDCTRHAEVCLAVAHFFSRVNEGALAKDGFSPIPLSFRKGDSTLSYAIDLVGMMDRLRVVMGERVTLLDDKAAKDVAASALVKDVSVSILAVEEVMDALWAPRPHLRLIPQGDMTQILVAPDCNQIPPCPLLSLGSVPLQKPFTSNQQMSILLLSLLVQSLYVRGDFKALTELFNEEGFKALKYFAAYSLNQIASVRPSMAYLWCILSVMQHAPRYCDLPPVEGKADVQGLIYCLGDSHILSLAWHPFPMPPNEINNEDGENFGGIRIAVPVLVPGLKVWHLGKSGTLFTRSNFLRTYPKIPAGSTVLLSMGEIDVRESVNRVVEKGFYPSSRAFYKALVDIYREIVEPMSELFKTVYVLYPPSVIRETRVMILDFWKALDDMFAELSNPLPRNIVPVRLNHTLTPDGYRLQSQYELDGTHLSPSVVPSLFPQMSVVERLA